MPAESAAQQEFMAIQYEKAKKGESHKVPIKVAKEFAETKRSGLPKHVSRENRRSAGKR